MLSHFQRTLNLVCQIFCLLLSSCTAPFWASSSRPHELDVSHDFKKGQVMGKEFELLHKVFLIQSSTCRELSLDIMPPDFSKNNKWNDPNFYIQLKTIPSGTHFKICAVVLKTHKGISKLRILASLMDENGNLIFCTDFFGKVKHIEVTDLFENTAEIPNDDWIIHAKDAWIRCIPTQNAE